MGSIQIISTTAAGTVTAFLPIALNAGGTASACISGTASTGINASAEGTTISVLEAEDWNTLSSWRYEPVPERRPRIVPTVFGAVRFSVAPAASLTVDTTFQYYELM